MLFTQNKTILVRYSVVLSCCCQYTDKSFYGVKGQSVGSPVNDKETKAKPCLTQQHYVCVYSISTLGDPGESILLPFLIWILAVQCLQFSMNKADDEARWDDEYLDESFDNLKFTAGR